MKRKYASLAAGLSISTMLFISGCATATLGTSYPVRAYLYANQSEPRGFGAYGYLVFTARPSEKDAARYKNVCDAFQRGLIETWGNFPEERASQMATFWPLRVPVPTGVPDFSCEMLVKNYDYRRASGIATVIRKQSARGPVLVAWAKPFGEENSSDALVFDLSDFSDEDLDRAFAIWRDRITRNPSVWRDGFNIVLCREACRSLLQKYGATILAIIHPSRQHHSEDPAQDQQVD